MNLSGIHAWTRVESEQGLSTEEFVMKCPVADEFCFFLLSFVGQEKSSSSRLLLLRSRRKSLLRAPRTKKELKKIGC